MPTYSMSTHGDYSMVKVSERLWLRQTNYALGMVKFSKHLVKVRGRGAKALTMNYNVPGSSPAKMLEDYRGYGQWWSKHLNPLLK